MADKQRVAVLGAGGTMGFAMTRNLAQAGFALTAWNRSRKKAEALGDDGVRVVDSPTEALDGAEVIITMLADADAVIDTLDQAVPDAREDRCIWVQMSTIGEDGTDRCAELAAERRLTFVDAPVLGTKQPAEEGKLVILASGPEETQAALGEIFDAVGQRTMWLGDAGMGSRLKVAINSWLVAVVEGGAETLALAAGMGVDPHLVLGAVKGGALDMPYLQMKGKAMIEGHFEPSFRLALAAKDAGLAEASAKRHNLDLPLISTIRQRLDEGVKKHGDEDLSATYLTSAPN